LEQLPECNSPDVPSRNNGRVEERLGELAGLSERQFHVDALELVNKVHKNLDPGSQIQHALDLPLSFKRFPYTLILPRAFQLRSYSSAKHAFLSPIQTSTTAS